MITPWSMLVPLETLPGWPKAADPSVLEVLGLLVGAPLVVILLVALIARVHHAVRGNAGVPGVANQPIWVNGQRVEPAITEDSNRDSVAAGRRAIEERMERDGAEGGAGARW